jgi:hypothetical protein
MKNIVIFSIFAILIIFSLQQLSFGEYTSAEAAERKQAVEEAHEQFKRKIIPTEKEEEKEEVTEEPKITETKSKLKKLLPTEEKLEEITYRTIWQYVDKQSTLDEEVKIETLTAFLRDITRVYDPLDNKYKVSTIQIDIIKYDDIYEFEYYWDEISSNTLKEIFDNAYLIGSPNENIDCMFNHSKEGAVTMCKTDEYLVQSIIFDKYQEHFSYNKLKIGPQKLQLNQDEMTTRIVQEILKNIEKKEGIESDYELYKILESNREKIENKNKINEKENNIEKKQGKMESLGIEKDKKYGIQNFSCIKDEFGLVTISGQFNNNQIKKDKVILEILFLDFEQNIIFKNTANLLDVDEFETKRFIGNTKTDKSFLTCIIKSDN